MVQDIVFSVTGREMYSFRLYLSLVASFGIAVILIENPASRCHGNRFGNSTRQIDSH